MPKKPNENTRGFGADQNRFQFSYEGSSLTCRLKAVGTLRLWVFRWDGRLFSTGIEAGIATAEQVADRAIQVIRETLNEEAPAREPRRVRRVKTLPAIRPRSIRAGEVTYPEYVRALQLETVDTLSRIPGVCLSCGDENLLSLVIFFARERYCPKCVEMTRRCRDCQRLRPVTEFDVVISGKQRIESDCGECRAKKDLRRYHEAMRSSPLPTGSVRCATCRLVKSVRAFYRNPLYANGVYPDCKLCRNGKWNDYREGIGAAVVDAAQAAYRRKRRPKT